MEILHKVQENHTVRWLRKTCEMVKCGSQRHASIAVSLSVQCFRHFSIY